MQEIFGTAVFVIILLIGLLVGIDHFRRGNLWDFLFTFVGTVVGVYLALAVIGVVLWAITWIGIFLREIVQWFIEAILTPFKWFF